MDLDFSDAADEFILAVCDLVGHILEIAPEVVHQCFLRELSDPSENRTFEEYEQDEGAAIDNRTAELVAPFINHRLSARNYMKKSVRDGWAGRNGKSLWDVLLFACFIVQEGFAEEIAVDGNVSSLFGECKQLLRFQGSGQTFDCGASQAEETDEEIQKAMAELEHSGLIEWTGEWRTGRDGTLEKVWRSTGKRQLH